MAKSRSKIDITCQNPDCEFFLRRKEKTASASDWTSMAFTLTGCSTGRARDLNPLSRPRTDESTSGL